ncbi:hypothetical protein GCM10018793_61250 [Streptomyces sulfonofaciens]|uniref:Integral membrane protein n=1 Tax=Streptomyces sulfonofaciens TaxID=68272 RepID=A0A919L881_9ACTN|nr:hypothetical protein [Streptomyces sulfonofaciens]GHH87039.1 hypothetical protein GCM10018793_61250 [Streptomyces sulfonofaciens]
MRTARLLTASFLAAAVTGLAAAAPAPAAGPDGLQVSPFSAAPGATVTVHTAACGAGGMATGDASTVGAGRFALAPGAGRQTGRFTVPRTAQPGTYEIVATCQDRTRVSGDLAVMQAAAGYGAPPKGHVATGVGGALGPDPVRTAGGIAALGVAAAGGTWLLHRRVRGDAL